VDASFLLLRLLSFVGLADNLYLPSAETVLQRRRR
jgi:hypothetical protein